MTGLLEVRHSISSLFTVAILLTGVKSQAPLSSMHAAWRGHRAIPRHRKFAPAELTLWLTHTTGTVQLVAAHSRSGGRERKKAADQNVEMPREPLAAPSSPLWRVRTTCPGPLLRLRGPYQRLQHVLSVVGQGKQLRTKTETQTSKS